MIFDYRPMTDVERMIALKLGMARFPRNSLDGHMAGLLATKAARGEPVYDKQIVTMCSIVCRCRQQFEPSIVAAAASIRGKLSPLGTP